MSATYALRRRDGNASDAIAAILHPNMGYREQLRERGIKPKDYERANRLQLKQMQIQKRAQREREEAEKREVFKLTRFKSVEPRVYQSQQKGSVEKEGSTKPHEFLRRSTSLSSDLGRKPTNGSHERTATRETSLVGKRESGGKDFNRARTTSRQHLKPPIPSRQELEELNQKLEKLHCKEREDYVNANAWEVIKKTPTRPSDNNSNDGEKKVHNSYGRIPEYLLQRKEQWLREEEERRRNAPDPDCPPGMVQMEEEERLKTLEVLQQSLQKVQKQVIELPLRVETRRQVQWKQSVEARLQEIEDALIVFSKPKVYVTKPVDKSTETECSARGSRDGSRRSSVSSAVAA